MSRLLPIDFCGECKHRYMGHCRHLKILFGHGEPKPIDFRHQSTKDFPDWCPLDEVKDEQTITDL